MRLTGLLLSFALVGSVLACKTTPEHSVALGGTCEKDVDCPNFAECLQLGEGKKMCTRGCNLAQAAMGMKDMDCPSPLKCEQITYTQKAGTQDLGSIPRKMCVP